VGSGLLELRIIDAEAAKPDFGSRIKERETPC
jgi:hypothetical protein